MQVCELVELGAFIATNCQVFPQWTDPLVERHIEQYWLASRCRQDRWCSALHAFRTRTDAQQTDPAGQDIRPTIQEILAGELLTRIWAAVTSTPGAPNQPSPWEPIARNVWVGHLEASNRALRIIVHGQGLGDADRESLNQLRHRVDRWTDLLLARIMRFHDVSEFGVQPDRVCEFADDFTAEQGSPGSELAWQLTLDSLRASFEQSLNLPSPNTDLNRRIASEILASFPIEPFEKTGLLDGKWMLRLEHTAQDMETLIREFDRIGKLTRPGNAIHC